MSIRDILVHMDSAQSCASRLAAAIQVATKHDAQLIGLYPLYRPRIPAYAEVEIPADVLERQFENIVEAGKQAEMGFYKAAEVAGVTTAWKCPEGDPVELLATHARYADLLVVSQRNPDGAFSSPMDDVAEQLILTTGRPVLVVPYNYQGNAIGSRVMVGWDAGQRAARAMQDAIPILQKADEVSVMAVNPKSNGKDGGNMPEVGAAAHLSRHGVTATADHVVATELSVEDQLLARSADMSADLLVTGAYGHARWKELILGGVTRHLLDVMPIPVLMSH